MARHATATHRNSDVRLGSKQNGSKPSFDDRSVKDKRADWLLDRQIDLPLYALLGILVAHALSGTSSFSLPHLSTRLPHSIQTLLPTWARHLPFLAPFATELPNASRDSKFVSNDVYWTTSGYAGPFRSDAAGFGHPLTALHNLTRACLGLSYEVRDKRTAFGSSSLPDDLRYGQSYYDRYPWNSWMSQAEAGPSFWVRKYEKGFKDVWFVMTGILIFTVLRALVVRHLLAPLASVVIPPAKRTNSRVEDAKAIRQRRRMCMRFAEQAWIVIWGTVSLGLSLFVASREPYWGSELALWTDWPYRQLTGLTKFYYLLQTAFWVQQVIVINVEDRRKDHWQMFTHHIVTILLLFGSYVSHFTPIGNVILILMDPCDILLAMAKCLRYAGMQLLCDIGFGLFMVGWIITRHIFYGRAIYSCISTAREYLPESPGATRQHYLGFRTFMPLGLVCLLCVLQIILCVWLAMIVRVAWRVVTGQGATDTRSDEESEGEAEQQPQHTTQSSTPSSTTVTTQASLRPFASTQQNGKRRKGNHTR